VEIVVITPWGEQVGGLFSSKRAAGHLDIWVGAVQAVGLEMHQKNRQYHAKDDPRGPLCVDIRGKVQANAGVMLVPLGTGKENAAERSAMGPDKKLREMKYKVSEF